MKACSAAMEEREPEGADKTLEGGHRERRERNSRIERCVLTSLSFLGIN